MKKRNASKDLIKELKKKTLDNKIRLVKKGAAQEEIEECDNQRERVNLLEKLGKP
jgi:hypothetical protein